MLVIPAYRGLSSHLHASSPLARFVFTVICRLFGVKSVVTYHGELGRFGPLRNFFDFASVLIADVPLVLNLKSLGRASSFNKNTLKITAFIPSLFSEPLDVDVIERINGFTKRFGAVFCTNAFNISFDIKKKETYGIIDLIIAFSRIENVCLLISDPSSLSSLRHQASWRFARQRVVFVI